jgi:hypothetical protein
MRRSALALSSVALAATALLSAQRATTRPPARKISTTATCAAELGAGVKSHRRFCDVVITRDPAAGILLTIPVHTGTATLRFDLHNRFVVPSADVAVGSTFMRQTAVVAVIRPTGTVIDRAAIVSEFRTVADLFDLVGGGTGPGGAKGVAPGRAEPIEITIPAAVSSISIVGVSLEVTGRTGGGVFDTPGRPVAIVSNWRIEY